MRRVRGVVMPAVLFSDIFAAQTGYEAFCPSGEFSLDRSWSPLREAELGDPDDKGAGDLV